MVSFLTFFYVQLQKQRRKKFIRNFVCGYLAKQAQDLVKLEEDGPRLLVRFNDMERMSLKYCGFEQQREGKALKSDTKSREDNIKNIFAFLEKEGSLKKVEAGKNFEQGNEYLTFQVLDVKMQCVLRESYPDRKNSRMVM